jgi:TonB family protein
MKYVIAFLLMMLVGCTASRQTDVPFEQPELISTAPLPPLASVSSAGGLNLRVLLHVMEDGTVADAKLLESSEDPGWDSLALQSMKQWRYTPPRRNGTPFNIWVRQLVVVQLQEPIVMTLGELVCSNRQKADSLYSLIENGADFDGLVKQTPGASSNEGGGSRGAVDIAVYPRHVRDQLKKLREDQVTRPLRVGLNYVIYKRFK